MLNTLRSVIDDDAKWFADIHDFYQAFKYKNDHDGGCRGVVEQEDGDGPEGRSSMPICGRQRYLPLQLKFDEAKPERWLIVGRTARLSLRCRSKLAIRNTGRR